MEILQEKISVFEEPEHAQIHANAGNEPPALSVRTFRPGNPATEPEIHARCRKEQRRKWRVPGAIKNIARCDQQVFSQRPATETPVERDDDYEKDDESERIKKHGEKPKELICRTRQSIYASHIEEDVLVIVFKSGKIDIGFL